MYALVKAAGAAAGRVHPRPGERLVPRRAHCAALRAVSWTIDALTYSPTRRAEVAPPGDRRLVQLAGAVTRPVFGPG